MRVRRIVRSPWFWSAWFTLFVSYRVARNTLPADTPAFRAGWLAIEVAILLWTAVLYSAWRALKWVAQWAWLAQDALRRAINRVWYCSLDEHRGSPCKDCGRC